MPSPIAELLGALARVCQRLALRWYLFGAQAAIVHGAARLTGDVDATVVLGELTPAALIAALETEGFRVRVPDVDAFVNRTRVLPLEHRGAAMPLDLVLAGPGLEELFLERAQEHTIEGIAIPVACAEDIVAMKILAGRPKDIDDAVAILAAHQGTLRIGLIRNTLQLLEQALGQSDLLPSFEQARVRAGG
jgi:hypothetical protein